MRPYAILARLDRPVGVWLLLLPCFWAIVLASGDVRLWGRSDLFLVALFVLGAFVMRSAGCVINDMWDRKLDRKVERTSVRPLACGSLSVMQALIFLCMLLSVGLLILLQMNMLTIILGVMSLPLIATYPLMKRFTWWPQAFLGLTFNFGALMGWSAFAGDLSFAAVLLYVSGFFWTLGYDTIYAHQDMEDDALAGIKSTALKFGEKSKAWVGIFYLFSLFALMASLYLATDNIFALLMILPPGLHLSAQIMSWKMKNPESALRVFKSNRNYGLLVTLCLIVAGLI